MGVIPTIGPYLLPRVLPAVAESYPALQVFLREDMTARLLEQLEEGKLDLLLLAIDIDLGGVATQPLFADPFVLAVPEDDELAGAQEVSLSDLEGRGILLLDEGHCLRAQTLPLCDSAGRRRAGRLPGLQPGNDHADGRGRARDHPAPRARGRARGSGGAALARDPFRRRRPLARRGAGLAIELAAG